jgi:choline-sulfatase
VFALAVLAMGAGLEARWAHGVATQPLNVVRAWLVAFGLMVPVAFVVALGVSALSPIIGFSDEADAAPGRAGGERRARWVAALPVIGLAVAVLIGLVAHLALGVLALDLPPSLVAACLGLGTLVLARLVLGAALAVTERLIASATWRNLPLWAAVTLAVVGFLAPLTWGIARGTPNGEGGFWAIFGVLRRQELDLRAALLLGSSSVAAYVGARLSSVRLLPMTMATAAALASLGATAVRLLDDSSLSLALERGGALSRASLRSLRAVTDRDADGVSKYFGSHDCDDTRDDVYPGAQDVAGNGIDEDCTGSDAAPVIRALSPAPPQVEAVQPSLPANLNVIFITVDTLRHDLGYTGYPRPISASLDRLAARSVVFDRAYALASYTGKSVGPLLIGKYPSETKRGWLHFNRFGAEEKFVQERLQAAGVRTISVQGHWYFTPEYGLGRGFDVLDMSAAPAKRQLEGDKTVNSDKLSDAAIRQLSQPENTQHPFFMWVHYLDPHADYIRHPGFDFGPRGRDLYDSEVAFTDQQIGRLIDFVEASGLAERTVIIVTSDHGEAFGEHGMWRHGFELWEALVRVPLLVHVPGVAPGRHQLPRGAIDLAPTLLSLFRVPLPGGDDRLSGQSLLPDIVMPAGHIPEPRPVFIDMPAGPYNEERQALIQDEIKLIVSAGRTIGLYDLARDPAELVELMRDAELLARSRERLAAFQAQLRLIREKPP